MRTATVNRRQRQTLCIRVGCPQRFSLGGGCLRETTGRPKQNQRSRRPRESAVVRVRSTGHAGTRTWQSHSPGSWCEQDRRHTTLPKRHACRSGGLARTMAASWTLSAYGAKYPVASKMTCALWPRVGAAYVAESVPEPRATVTALARSSPRGKFSVELVGSLAALGPK